MSEVRVRFAPSPTGYLHVGNARTAILNWLFARHCQGRMILRIEDTDVERSSLEYENTLYDDLQWMGLDWDEGPKIGGNFGPYRQSERLEIYQNYAKNLIGQGDAFYCYCTAEEIKEKGQAAIDRGEDPHYDGNCYNLSDAQIQQYKNEGRRPVIRFRIPTENVSFSDLIRGDVSFEGSSLSDFVILRSDGIATYNFAVVLDDALMQISHVIRGEDHLSNTPKQVLLFNALKFSSPIFVHIPMILGEDRSKLSKRHGDNQLRDYRDKGYLPEAMVNFLSLLSWSSPSGNELLSSERLIKEFDFSRVSKSAAIFNLEKLNWMNGWYLRNSNINRILELSIPFLEKEDYDLSNREYVTKCILAVIERVDYLQQLSAWCRMFFQEKIFYENEKLITEENSRKIFNSFLSEIQSLSEWNRDLFFKVMKSVQKSTGIKGKDLWMPIRIALTGREHGPELPVVVELLGLEKCKNFIKKALFI